MRKITLLTTATLLSLACLGSTTLSVDATARDRNYFKCGNKIFIIRNISPQRPCPPSQSPDIETPDTETPDIETPETNTPENESPDINVPNIPDNNQPETETPENESPDINQPETEIPENNPGTEVPDTEVPEHDTNASYIEQVVALVNIERAKEGISPLTVDTNVQEAAQVRAKEIESSFSHTRPDGSSFSTALTEQNVSYRRAGENIAWGQRSPKEVVNAWMNSSGHRANIMNRNFTKIGVGYYQDAKGVNYWSQLFIG